MTFKFSFQGERPPAWNGFLVRKSLDALNLRALALELRELLVGASLQKFSQLTESEYWLSFARREEDGWQRRTLLVSLSTEESRLHLVTGSKPGAQTPSSFTMLARKHLVDNRLEALEHPDLERVVYFRFGYNCELIASLTGRDNNLILVRSGKVLGAHQLGGDVRPGRPFSLPDRPTVPSADQVSWNQLVALAGHTSEETLLGAVFGLTRPVARELARTGRWDEFWTELQVGRRPGVTPAGKLTFRCGPQDTPYPTMQAAAEAAWGSESVAPGLDRHRAAARRTLEKHLARAHRKRDNVTADLAQARQFARLQHEGDLILANLAHLQSGSRQVLDWESGAEVELQLDPELSVQANAEKRYRTARRRKRAIEPLTERLDRVAQEVEFLEELQLAVERSGSEAELQDVMRSVVVEKATARPSRPSVGPRRYRLDGFDILVGRNPAQNEQLATRVAARDDLWFHAREIPGAHVIVKTAGRSPGPRVLEAAAVLAARHSRAAQDTRVPVCYTLAQKLKKPPNSPPGKVLYKGEETVFVDPRQELAELESVP